MTDERQQVKRVEVRFVDNLDGSWQEVLKGDVQVNVHDGVLDLKAEDGTRTIWPLARIAVVSIEKVEGGRSEK